MRKVFPIAPLLLAVLVGGCADAPESGESLVALRASPPEMVFAIEDTFSLRAIGKDAAGGLSEVEAVWTSSAPAIVAIDAAGIATGLALGEATLTARRGGLSAKARVRVVRRVAELHIVPQEVRLLPGDAIDLELVARDASGAGLSKRARWSSSAPTVASVDDEGRLSAHAVGEATIEAEAEGIRAEARVAVSPLPPHSIEILAPQQRVEVGKPFELQALVRDREGGTIDGMKVLWESSSPLALSLRPDGEATFLRPARAEAVARIGEVEARIELEGFLRYQQILRLTNSAGREPTYCGLDARGMAFCHGDNFYGQLGDGTSHPTPIPVPVKDAPPFVRLEAPRAREEGTVSKRTFNGITADGRVFRWGEGAPAGNWVDLPYKVVRRIDRPWMDDRWSGPEGTFPIEGWNYCDLTDRGAAICDFGQATREGLSLPPTPDPKPVYAPIVEVAGAHLFCWRYETGEVSCGSQGENPDGRTIIGFPIALPEPAIQLAAAGHSACALGESGALYCWQDVHELLPRTLVHFYWVPRGLSPVLTAETPFPLTEILSGWDRVCGMGDGKVVCWDLGILTNGSLEDTSWLGAPYELDLGGLDVESIDLFSNIVRTRDGLFWQLGDPPELLPFQP